MSGDLLRIVDSIHRDKNIDSEVVFSGIEAAIITAAKKHYGEEEEIDVRIDRDTGRIVASHNGELIDMETLGRIAAQSAKQIVIQKVREAERDATYDEYVGEKGTVVVGVVQRVEGGAAIVNIGKAEALLPRSEQMPGELYHPGERVRAAILDVRKSGQRVKIILSRNHPDLIRRLFEQEIPEIAERIIEIRAIAREAGYRTKVAVSSIDSKVDCVGACVGVRGSRIKNVLDELGGERIDIIRYNESLQVMIPNALAPAQIEEVQIYPRIGRAIVLVREDQLSLAIGKRGQNVRLASKLAGIDIEIMTFDELTEEVERAEANFSRQLDVAEDVIDALIGEGIFSFDDLSVMEPEHLIEVTGLSPEEASALIEQAETEAERQPQEVTTRSSIVSNPTPHAPTAAQVAEQLLGPSEPKAEPKVPSVHELFRDEPIPPPSAPEQKFTAERLFGPDETAEAASPEEAKPLGDLSPEGEEDASGEPETPSP